MILFVESKQIKYIEAETWTLVTRAKEVGEMGRKREENLNRACKLQTFAFFGQHKYARMHSLWSGGTALYSLQFNHNDNFSWIL